MPLENSTQIRELNPAWPLDSDIASTGAAHLRLIKRMIGTSYIGTFANAEAAVAHALATNLFIGSTFYTEGRLWLVVPKNTLNNEVDVDDSWFSLNTSFGALALNSRKRQGRLDLERTGGIYSIQTDLRRRPLVKHSIVETGDVFSAPAASNVFMSELVQGDVVYQETPSQVHVRVWDGSAWQPVTQEFLNLVAVYGSLSAREVLAEKVDSTISRAVKRETLGKNNLHVFDPDGFGADNLIEWFGEKAFNVSSDGDVAYGALSKLNAIYYKTAEGTQGAFGEDEGEETNPTGVGILPNFGTLDSLYTAKIIPEGSSVKVAVILTFLPTGVFTVTLTEPFTEITEGSPLTGDYLTPSGPSAASEYQIRVSIGNPVPEDYVGVVLNTWLSLSSSRVMGLSLNTRGSTSVLSERSVTATVTIRKNGDAATEVTRNISLSAVVFSGAN